MLSIGMRVVHKEKGLGTVLMSEQGKNVLVQWDRHRVNRETAKLNQTQSHVKPSSLRIVDRGL